MGEEYLNYSAGASPTPSHPPYFVRKLHFVEISQERYSLLGMLKLQGGGVIHQYFMHSVAVPPNVDRPLGGTLPRERERNGKRQRDTGSREEKEKISRCTDMGLVPVVNFIC